MPPTQPTYHLRVLGCPKNQVDGGYLEGLMEGRGHRPVGTPEEADTVIVHTCGFIEAAAQESVDTLLELGELKKRNPGMRLVASGCLGRPDGHVAATLHQALEVAAVHLVLGTAEHPEVVGRRRRSHP